MDGDRWSCQRRGVEESGNPEDFYGDHCCQDIFQNFLVTITSRINTITNTAYRCEQQPCTPNRQPSYPCRPYPLDSINPTHVATHAGRGYILDG